MTLKKKKQGEALAGQIHLWSPGCAEGGGGDGDGDMAVIGTMPLADCQASPSKIQSLSPCEARRTISLDRKTGKVGQIKKSQQVSQLITEGD